LDSLILARPSPRNIEQHLCADKAYDFDDIRLPAMRRGYITHIPHREAGPATRQRGQKAHRWVIERTNRWHNRFRRLKIRYEVHARNDLAFVHLANAMICFRRGRA
jgi:putative transposase